eukprot:5239883-Amphidinium_carterae.1
MAEQPAPVVAEKVHQHGFTPTSHMLHRVSADGSMCCRAAQQVSEPVVDHGWGCCVEQLDSLGEVEKCRADIFLEASLSEGQDGTSTPKLQPSNSATSLHSQNARRCACSSSEQLASLPAVEDYVECSILTD